MSSINKLYRESKFLYREATYADETKLSRYYTGTVHIYCSCGLSNKFREINMKMQPYKTKFNGRQRFKIK